MTFKTRQLINPICSLYREGKTVDQIALNFKINKKTVRKVLRSEDIQIKKGKKNILGQKFGNLTVYKFLKNDNNQKAIWRCKCSCGKESDVRCSDLTTGKQRSCGCLRNETSLINIKKAIQFVKDNPEKSNFGGFKNLTGKYLASIKHNALIRNLEFLVEPEYLWNLFVEQKERCALSGVEIFIPERYGKERQTASLDRINSNKGYIKGNVQWVHKDINIMKLDLDESRFIWYCKKVTEKNETRNSL